MRWSLRSWHGAISYKAHGPIVPGRGLIPEKRLPGHMASPRRFPFGWKSSSDVHQSLKLQFFHNQLDFLEHLPAAAGEIREGPVPVGQQIDDPLAAAQREGEDILVPTTPVRYLP